MKKYINTALCMLLACFLCPAKISATTRVSACCGDWSNAATWSPSGVPACGDSVMIRVSDTVRITNQQNYSACAQAIKIVIKGMFKFYNGSKLRLPCGSYILVYPGGSIQADVGLANSNLIEICNVVEWNSNNPVFGPYCIPASNPMCQGVLPIELMGFSAEIRNGNAVLLRWETVSEKNNDHFEIERSEDGFNFRNIFSVKTQATGGNSPQKLSYDVIDRSPSPGINYYRLSQVDKDGTQSKGTVIVIKAVFESGLRLSVYPNSNSGEFTIYVAGLKDEKNIRVVLRNSEGSVVYKSSHEADDFQAQIKVAPQTGLVNGVYLCSVYIEDSEYKIKVVIINS